MKSPWNLWAVHAHCDVITRSGVPFASKYSRLTRDCSVAGNKRTSMLQYGTGFLLVCLVSFFFSPPSFPHFVGIKEYHGKDGLKMQESREWEGKLFSRTRNNALILRNIWICSPFFFVDIILYICVCVCVLFSDEGVEFLKRFFFFNWFIHYTIKTLRGLNNILLSRFFSRFSMFVSLEEDELKHEDEFIKFPKS